MKVKLTNNEDFIVERGSVSVNVLDLSTKQDALVSGTNIKTINNESILGSGNISIAASGVETDPVFSASAAAGITSSDITNWNGKQSALTFDNSPTVNSNNPVKSGGVYDSFANYCPIIEDTRTSATNVITATAPFSTLTDGQKIVLVTKYSTYGTSPLPTLNLTLSDNTTTGGKALYYHRNGTQQQIGYSNFQMPAGTCIAVYRQTPDAWFTDWNTVYYGSVNATQLNESSTQNNLISAKVLRDNFYTESEVDALIPTVPTNVSDFTNDAGYLTSFTEVDPVFTASVASGITSSDISNWGTAYTNNHTHSNKSVLDDISSSDISNWNSKTDNVGTITGITMNNVSKGTSGVVDLGTVITSETSLSKGTTTGSGNAVTDISVNGHQITLTKGTTFLTSHQDITGLADGIYYDSTNKRIYLRNGSNNLSGSYAYIDATDFIKDGMVDSVTVGNGTGSNAGVTCLIITFNTFNGSPTHQTIELPISQIFNASNYYTKSDIDNAGYLTSFTEVDPVFTASVASGITSSDISNWNGKTSNVGTVTGVKMNNGSAISPNSSGVVDLGTVITSHQNIKTVNNNSLTGTGNISVGTVTGVKMNGTTNNPTSGVVDLGTIITSETTLTKGTTTGSGNAVTDISVNGHQITLAKDTTFLTSHQTLKTINNTAITGSGNITINELPTVSESDNGKVLQVVNGAWALVSPVTLYSGSSTPNNAQGNNGDIYLQI